MHTETHLKYWILIFFLNRKVHILDIFFSCFDSDVLCEEASDILSTVDDTNNLRCGNNDTLTFMALSQCNEILTSDPHTKCVSKANCNPMETYVVSQRK